MDLAWGRFRGTWWADMEDQLSFIERKVWELLTGESEELSEHRIWMEYIQGIV
jgi:hypothetical protein